MQALSRNRDKGADELVARYRIENGKRIDLQKWRDRKAALPKPVAPIEDTRVSSAWERQEARDRVAERQMLEAKSNRPTSHLEIGSAEVDNPYFSRSHSDEKSNHRKILASVNVRESAVSMLAARGVIEAHQVAAADQFRLLWEALGGAGARAIDMTKEAVDGGKIADPIRALQFEAGIRLKAARDCLVKVHGEYAYRLVGYIAGEGRSIHDLTETRRQRDTMTDNLRMYLDTLARFWGMAT